MKWGSPSSFVDCRPSAARLVAASGDKGRPGGLRYLLLVGWALAIGICTVSIWRGEWKEFGAWLAQITTSLHHPGRRTAFLLPWILPVAAAYALTLSSGIFWGLRQREKLRR